MAALKNVLPQKKAGRKARLNAAQERWLKMVFATLPNRTIADKLTAKSKDGQQYTTTYIQQQGHRLRLKKDRVKYSENDLQFIATNIHSLTWQEIADHLNRTPGAVRKKWHELK